MLDFKSICEAPLIKGAFKGGLNKKMEKLNVWNTYNLEMQKKCDDFAKQYMQFLDDCKTERECIDRIVCDAEAAGYIELSRAIEEGRKLKCGDKVYCVWMNKSIALFHIGEEPMEHGINILGAIPTACVSIMSSSSER